MYSNAYFNIYYDTSKCTSSEAAAIASYMQKLRTDYINLGFATPILEPSSSKYNIYITPNSKPGDSNTLASAFMVNYSGNKCASYIVVYNYSSITNILKETLSHEYFHAIQNAYNCTSGWFKEACANWGGTMVSGYDENAGRWFHNFLLDPTRTINKVSGYYSYFLPYCMQKDYGGVATVVEFYNLYSN